LLISLLNGRFSKIQTQALKSLLDIDKNIFIGAPTGIWKTVCAGFALPRQWSKDEEPGRAVYIGRFQELVDKRCADWKSRLIKNEDGKEIVKLTGETSTELKLLKRGDQILAAQ